MAAKLHLLRWLCEELVNALLRPVFIRYSAARAHLPFEDIRETPQSARYFSFFTRLVNSAPCWPCRIIFERGGRLQIFSAPDDGWSFDAEDYA